MPHKYAAPAGILRQMLCEDVVTGSAVGQFWDRPYWRSIGSKITNADISEAFCPSGVMVDSRMSYLVFRSTNLEKSVFVDSALWSVSFCGVNLRDTYWQDVVFDGCVFRCCDVAGAVFQNCKMLSPIIQATSFSGATVLQCEGFPASKAYVGVREITRRKIKI